MAELEKLMITVTTANSWIYPETKNWPTNVDEMVDCVVRSYEAGAAIAHIHLFKGKEKELVDKIRDECDIIIQAGMSSDDIPDRIPLFESKPDLASIILSHHDESFVGLDVYKLHPREELEEYCKVCKKYGVKPEWEVWNTGSLWNLKYLIDKGLLKPPHFLSVFFNWPGGQWSPPTARAFDFRKEYFPKGSVYTASVMGSEQAELFPQVLLDGGHIRVGTEDYPFITEGVKAKDNPEIVDRWVNVAKTYGREIATPSEARKIIGI